MLTYASVPKAAINPIQEIPGTCWMTIIVIQIPRLASGRGRPNGQGMSQHESRAMFRQPEVEARGDSAIDECAQQGWEHYTAAGGE